MSSACALAGLAVSLLNLLRAARLRAFDTGLKRHVMPAVQAGTVRETVDDKRVEHNNSSAFTFAITVSSKRQDLLVLHRLQCQHSTVCQPEILLSGSWQS